MTKKIVAILLGLMLSSVAVFADHADYPKNNSISKPMYSTSKTAIE